MLTSPFPRTGRIRLVFGLELLHITGIIVSMGRSNPIRIGFDSILELAVQDSTRPINPELASVTSPLYPSAQIKYSLIPGLTPIPFHSGRNEEDLLLPHSRQYDSALQLFDIRIIKKKKLWQGGMLHFFLLVNLGFRARMLHFEWKW